MPEELLVEPDATPAPVPMMCREFVDGLVVGVLFVTWAHNAEEPT